MKLLRYGAPGAEKPGVLDTSGRVRDLSGHVPDIAGEALRPASLDSLRKLDVETLPVVDGTPQDDLRLGPCVGAIGKFVCIGLNYADHAEEAGMEIPEEPIIFNKWTSAIVGPNDPIQIPRGSRKTDWEVELGVVIGEPGSYIDEADAMKHVAGLCVINDVSEREFQIERAGTWDKGKGCDTFGPTGPWLVTLDEIPDIDAMDMWLDVDGERMQSGSTATLIFKIPHLVSYCSQFMSLQPGDVISTGTPPGVGMGMSPPRYLHGGEVVSLGIAGLGEQRSKVLPAL
jgi:2,4-diketo-3-deoxy-L-fuconate hydrolase